MKQVRYFCSTNYQLNEFYYVLSRGFSSAHVPFQKIFVVCFLQEFDVEISQQKCGGYRIQSYFPSTVPGNAIASSHLLPLYSSTQSSSQRYESYKPSSESENSVEYFRWPRAAVHSLISLYKEIQLKNHYSDCQRFLNYGHLTGRFAQTLGRRRLM